jgi:hypothetical protein
MSFAEAPEDFLERPGRRPFNALVMQIEAKLAAGGSVEPVDIAAGEQHLRASSVRFNETNLHGREQFERVSSVAGHAAIGAKNCWSGWSFTLQAHSLDQNCNGKKTQWPILRKSTGRIRFTAELTVNPLGCA